MSPLLFPSRQEAIHCLFRPLKPEGSFPYENAISCPVQAAEAASGALPGLAAGRGGVRGAHDGRGHRHYYAPGCW